MSMGTRVYLGRLPHSARERDIERFFKGYGRIREIMLKNGYGFVEFDDDRDADDAVYELNGKELCGERVLIEHARGPRRGGGGGGGGYRGGGRDRGYGGYGGRDNRRPAWLDKYPKNSMQHSRQKGYGPPTRTDYRVIIENLSSRVSWQDLKDYMRQAGEVTYADAHKQYKNEGVVEFASYNDMKNAIEKLDDTEINGRRIRMIEDRPSRRRRSRSRSHSRSRSRSRHSRSRSRSESRDREGSRSRSRSRSRSADKDEGSPGPENGVDNDNRDEMDD